MLSFAELQHINPAWQKVHIQGIIILLAGLLSFEHYFPGQGMLSVTQLQHMNPVG